MGLERVPAGLLHFSGGTFSQGGHFLTFSFSHSAREFLDLLALRLAVIPLGVNTWSSQKTPGHFSRMFYMKAEHPSKITTSSFQLLRVKPWGHPWLLPFLTLHF